MGRRPMCLVCVLLMAAMCLIDWLGVPLIRGNPVPASVQEWIADHPETVVCGEAVRCADTEFSLSIYLEDASLVIYPSEQEQSEQNLSKQEQSEQNLSEQKSSKQEQSEQNPSKQKSSKQEQSEQNLSKQKSSKQEQSGQNLSKQNQTETIPIQNIRVFLKEKETVPAGTFLVLSGKLERVAAPRNPGEFDSRQYYACQHIYYFLKDAVIEKKSTGYSRYKQFLADVRERFMEILEAASGKDAPVFEAMVLGEKSNLEEETKLRYQMAGIIHVLAISGLHISLLGTGLFELLKRAGLGIQLSGILALAVMLQYGMMTGTSVSTMRAVCMFLISVTAKLLGRIYDSMTALAVSEILLLLESPAYLYSSSFLLSFGAVLGIGTAGPMLCKVFRVNRKRTEGFVFSLAIQLTTLPVVLMNYGEVPILGIFLNLIVLPTVGAVLICGICGGILGLGSIAAARLAMLPGRGLLMLYEKLCGLAGRAPFCTWVAGAPSQWQAIGYYLVTGGALLLAYQMAEREAEGEGKECWIDRILSSAKKKGKSRKTKSQNRKSQDRESQNRKSQDRKSRNRESRNRKSLKRKNQKRKRRISPFAEGKGAACICCLGIFLGIGILGFRHPKGLTITCLDVGQGDGIVLETPDGHHFLVDGGSSNKSGVGQYQILPYLKNQGISYLDAILVSHTDTDHISGIQELLGYMSRHLTTIRAGRLILPNWKEHSEAYQKLESLAGEAGVPVGTISDGDSIRAGDTVLHFIAPQKGASGKDVNEDGMVLEVTYGNFRGLFTGDIGEETEKKLISQGRLTEMDFLKVGHHGSRYSSSSLFLQKIRPEVSVISCSATNTYGHPSPETIERLEEAGSEIYYTMKNGAITVQTNGMTIYVRKYVQE